MDDQGLKHIMKQGMLSPSADFTGRLMKRVRFQEKRAKKIKMALIALPLMFFVVFVVSWGVSLPEVSIYLYSIKFPSIVSPVISILVFIYSLYVLLSLHEDCQQAKQV